MAGKYQRQPDDVEVPLAAPGCRGSHEPHRADVSTAAVAEQQPLFDSRSLDASQGSLATTEAAATSFSVSGLVSYRRCPRQYYWMVVRPLPRQASAAARIGTALHRWIEHRSDPQLGLLEPEFGVSDDDYGVVPVGVLSGLQAAFLASPFAQLDPLRVEAPFVLAVSGRAVRGRIDAVYRRGGRVDLVDFKTGSPPEDADRAATTQLDLYAIAASDVWNERATSLRTTYCYLREDRTFQLIETDWDDVRLASAREDLATSLGGLAAGDYGATPGTWCARCEWRTTCRPGRSFLNSLSPLLDEPG